MLAKVKSSTVFGIEARDVEAEVDIAKGLPSFSIVGLPDAACRESADRVRAAIKNSGYPFPSKKITVNLAPASLKKEGSSFDLAIAVGILVANGSLDQAVLDDKVFCGELALDGRLRSIPGILPRASSLVLNGAREVFVVPRKNAKEALCVKNLPVIAAESLSETLDFLKGNSKRKPEIADSAQCFKASPAGHDVDFSDIKGQEHVKRGLEVAAAGGHNVLMIGPPGSGKTMLAKRIPGILSSISFEEALETTKIHSVAGLLNGRAALLKTRPFRNPHHTISHVAMIGGGTHPKPGEVSLAHHGVLFLDELAEFRRDVLEVLRQPLEEGSVTIARAASTITLPARFMLIAAMNPCPCGYYTDPKKECHCTSLQIKNYMSKISGPLLDRIDIQLEVPPLTVEKITKKGSGETSSVIRGRVENARERQRERYPREKFRSNAQLGAKELESYCALSGEGESLLKMAIEELGFSARAYHKSIKVARTIADLEGSEKIEAAHISEAIHYRSLDRNIWF